MEAILVALITGGLSLLGVVITNMMAARRAEQRMVTAQAVTDARLEELTREVRAHNNFAQRVPVLEEQLRVCLKGTQPHACKLLSFQPQRFIMIVNSRNCTIFHKNKPVKGIPYIVKTVF